MEIVPKVQEKCRMSLRLKRMKLERKMKNEKENEENFLFFLLLFKYSFTSLYIK